jgi:hypothetical protein
MTGVTVVVDASALAEVVVRSERASHVEELLRGQVLIALDLINSEVLSVLRGCRACGAQPHHRAHSPVRHLAIDRGDMVRAAQSHALRRRLCRTGAPDRRFLIDSGQAIDAGPPLGVPLLTIRDETPL